MLGPGEAVVDLLGLGRINVLLLGADEQQPEQQPHQSVRLVPTVSGAARNHVKPGRNVSTRPSPSWPSPLSFGLSSSTASYSSLSSTSNINKNKSCSNSSSSSILHQQ